MKKCSSYDRKEERRKRNEGDALKIHSSIYQLPMNLVFET